MRAVPPRPLHIKHLRLSTTLPTSSTLLFSSKRPDHQPMRLRLFFFPPKIIVNRRMFRAFFRLPSRPSKTLRTLQENGSIFLDEQTPSSCSCYKIPHWLTFFLHLSFFCLSFPKNTTGICHGDGAAFQNATPLADAPALASPSFLNIQTPRW